MPNHVAVIGLGVVCSDDEVDLSPLDGADLCELAWPMPRELDGIECGTVRCRYRSKSTGVFHSHDDEAIPFDSDEWEQVPISDSEAEELRQRHGGADWYEWTNTSWGTKWGTYQTIARELGGDGSPVSIEFQCAWNEPSAEAMRRINKYLEDTYKICKLIWLAFDPYDNSTRLVEVAAREVPNG